jgi:hypothetical protein
MDRRGSHGRGPVSQAACTIAVFTFAGRAGLIVLLSLRFKATYTGGFASSRQPEGGALSTSGLEAPEPLPSPQPERDPPPLFKPRHPQHEPSPRKSAEQPRKENRSGPSDRLTTERRDLPLRGWSSITERIRTGSAPPAAANPPRLDEALDHP